jgi:hypothetical protein
LTGAIVRDRRIAQRLIAGAFAESGTAIHGLTIRDSRSNRVVREFRERCVSAPGIVSREPRAHLGITGVCDRS